jgi:hypothetical protein
MAEDGVTSIENEDSDGERDDHLEESVSDVYSLS